MYQVTIVSDNIAHVKIKSSAKDDQGEFDADLDYLQDHIPSKNRRFDWDGKYWEVSNFQVFAAKFPAFVAAYNDYKRQLRMF